MTNGTINQSHLIKYISLAILVIAPALSFYVWSKVEVSVMKEDAVLYRKIYSKDIRSMEKTIKHLEKRLDIFSIKEDKIEIMLQDIISDLKVIKYKLKIR